MSKEKVAISCAKYDHQINFKVTSMRTLELLHNIYITDVIFNDIEEWCNGKKIEPWRMLRFDRIFCRSGILLPDLEKEFRNIGFCLSDFARLAFGDKYSVVSVNS